LGANLSSGSSEDSIGLSLEVLPESADAAIAILADVLLHPAFRAADLKRVKREWLDNLTLQREDSATLAQLIGRRLLLGANAGENPLGTASQISKLTSASLSQFHRSAISPARCAVSAAGAITTESLRAMAERHFKNWAPSGAPLARREPTWAEHSRVVSFPRPDAVQTSIYLVSAAPSRNVPGHDARRVIDNFFGGLFTSRINLNLREKHAYTYGASSRLNANLFSGTWSIQSDVKSEVTAEAIEQVLLERKQLVAGTPATADEVARAKTDLIHDNAARLSHTNSLLGNLQAEFSQDLPNDYFAELEARISHVSPSELSAQLPEFSRDTAVLVLVGPTLESAPKWLGVELETLDAAWLQ
jgi:zinc protease